MAKAKTKTTNAKVEKTSALRKGALAYLGLFGVAYERATFRAEQVKDLYATKVKGSTDGLFTDLVARGEKVEELALDTAKTAQKRAVETFETTAGKVKAAVPFGANDRVEELEAEVTALNKKIASLSKKAAKTTAKKAGINKTVASKKAA